MTFARLTALLGLAAGVMALRASAYEVNAWPAFVLQKDSSGVTESWEAVGPLFFSGPTPGPEAGYAYGFRPIYVKDSSGESVRTDILYPLFLYRKYPDHYKWSILNLINGEGVDARVTKEGGPTDRHFDIWPIYFSHETADPVDTYHALLPIYGHIKYRLGFDQIFWAPFPLFVQTEKRATKETYVPWPIVRIYKGAEHGFALWPLFGVTEGPYPAHHAYYLWPLIWNNTLEPRPEAPEGSAPGTEFGVLPVYTRETGPGYLSENWVWPFFGHTEHTIPYRYSEQRYFWPFFVQGAGDRRLVNRWGPFYTHSNIKGTDSTWVGWPFWHQTTWADDDIRETKTQFFYFLYWCLDEKSESRPKAPHAYKRHVWPLYSSWDNGAGSRQLQIPSPFEVFFPDNPEMRANWTPLLALCRHDHRPTGETRTSLLWGAVTWRHDASRELAEFHIGPLLGMRREGGGPAWTFLGFDFRSKPNNVGRTSR
jgi:hypothetical protein